MDRAAKRPGPPRMSRAEIAARAATKERLVLAFLASGEVWTTAAIVQRLLGLSAKVVHVLLHRMQRDGLLASERIDTRLSLWGITSQGIAWTPDAAAGCQRFEPGRISPPFVEHHLDTQRARLAAEAAGWAWEPGKVLYNRGWQKVPDALATSARGERVAVEIERTIKTPLRYSQIILAALKDVKAGRYDRVQYLSPQGRADAVERALRKVESVKVGGDAVKLTAQHWARFSFANLSEWPSMDGQQIEVGDDCAGAAAGVGA